MERTYPAIRLLLRDDRLLSITRKSIEDASERTTSPKLNDVTVEIAGRQLPALALVAEALGTAEDNLRPNQAIAVLREFDFPVSTDEKPHVGSGDTAYASDDDDSVSDMTPALARSLARARGHWVAIHRGEKITEDSDLATVLRVVGSKPSTVLFVPLTGVINAAPST